MDSSRCIYAAGFATLGLIFGERLLRFLRQSGQVFNDILSVTLQPVLIQKSSQLLTCALHVREQTNKFPVIGLDCEWGSNTKRMNGRTEQTEDFLNACDDLDWVTDTLEKLALVQIALFDGTVYVIQMKSILEELDRNESSDDALSLAHLAEVLSDEKVTKVGVGIDLDVKKVWEVLNLHVASWFDLRYLAFEFNQLKLRGMGLAKLSGNLLGREMSKELQLSNWAQECLTEDQIWYAANDALVSLKVFVKFFTLFQITKQNSFEDFVQRVQPYFNQKYKIRGGTNPFNGSLNANHCSNKVTAAPGSSGVDSKSVIPVKYLYSSKSEIYSNGSLLAPDGQLLCTCSMNKLKWYCVKGLGEWVDDKRVKLFFEPANRPSEDSEYYRLPKKNMCVVCGRDEHMLRKNVVPVEYRKHFPDSIKSHQSHDTLVLCVGCHVQSNWHDLRMRRELERECEAPMGAIVSLVKKQPPLLLNKAIHAARALVAHMDTMPQQRIEELKLPVVEFVNSCEAEALNLDANITLHTLQHVANMKHQNPKNEALEPHGLKVCRSFVERGLGLEALKQRWRAHFKESMKPQYLPDLWCVEHRPKYKGQFIDDCSAEVLQYLEKGGKYQDCLKNP